MKSALLLGAVFGIYFAALHYFHTNKNGFTLLAAAMALPAGRSVVVSIMCLRARGASDTIRQAVSAVSGLSPAASGYDICLTAYDNMFPLRHAAAGGGKLAGLLPGRDADCALCEKYLREVLEREGFGDVEVRIFPETGPYVEELSRLAASCGQPPEREQELMQLLYALSL